MSTALMVILGLAVLLALWGIGIYNRLIQMRNQVNNAWSQIDVQLQRRYDLIPNLIEAVKGYMGYEKSTLETIVNARNIAQAARTQIAQSGGPADASPEAMQKLAAADSAVRSGLSSFFALAENYPQLKASENVQQLQEELSSTENRVAFARQAYNDNVMFYNTQQQEFPTNLFAAAFGHHTLELFQTDNAEVKKVPKVSF